MILRQLWVASTCHQHRLIKLYDHRSVNVDQFHDFLLLLLKPVFTVKQLTVFNVKVHAHLIVVVGWGLPVQENISLRHYTCVGVVDLSVVVYLFYFGFAVVNDYLLTVESVFLREVNDEIVETWFKEAGVDVDVIFFIFDVVEFWLVDALLTTVVQQIFTDDMSPIKQLIFK